MGFLTMRERFFAKTIPEPNSGCLLWTGAVNAGGYGKFAVARRATAAHRVAWELAHGPIPNGEGYHGVCVCHRCDTRVCVNADHLFLATQRENVRDCMTKDRFRSGAWEKALTHCPRGHAYSKENTLMDAGSRRCRTCRNERQRRRVA